MSENTPAPAPADEALTIERLFQLPPGADTDAVVRYFQALIADVRARQSTGLHIDSVVSVMSGVDAAGNRQFRLAATDVNIAQAIEMLVRASDTVEQSATSMLAAGAEGRAH